MFVSAADFRDKIPGPPRGSIAALFPFDGSYEDVTGSIKAQYFNAKEQKSFSTAEAAKSGAVFVPGRDEGKAIQFGDGKYDVPDSSSNVNIGQFNYDKDFTIAFWAKNLFKTPYGNYPVLFGNSNWTTASGTAGQGLLVSTLTNSSVIMNAQGEGINRISPRPVSNADADWHYITLTADRAAGKFSLYLNDILLIDGEKDGSYAPSVGKSMQNNAPTRIGSDGYSNYGFYGAIQDLMIFNKALSAKEVRSLVSAYTGKEFILPITVTYDSVKNEDGSVMVSATLKNENESVRKITAKFDVLGDGKLTAGEKEIVIEVPPQAAKMIFWSAKAETGSAKLFLTTVDGGAVETFRMGKVASGKAGWVSGDSHNHTKYSDGSGTIFENFAQAKNQGVDYITITDHGNSKGWAEALDAGPQYGIIPIRGNEFSHRTYSHAVFINVNQEKNYSVLDPPIAVKTFKEDTNGEGLVYVAHPFDNGKDVWQENKGWESPIDGIEVWNSWYAGRYVVNAKAFQKWDELNKRGRRLYGIATTDTHSARYIGEGYTTVFVKEYTVKGILDGHRAGNMYGSNGPVVDFRLGSAMMGDVVNIPKEGKTVAFEIKGEYILPLSKVFLIKNGEVVFTKEINANRFAERVEVPVKPGDFVRMEVDGTETDVRKLDGKTFDTAAPFAFTNPIFFVE